MTRPIRRDLLIHRVIHKPMTDNGGWNATHSGGSEVGLVRIEPVKNYIQMGSGEKFSNALILFWDNVHSDRASFALKDLIEWEGNEYTIEGINSFYDGIGLHHLELRLV